MLKKRSAVTNQRHSAIFRSIPWKRIGHGLAILESMFYSFPSDLTKIGGVSLIRNGGIGSRKILKKEGFLRSGAQIIERHSKFECFG